MENSPWLSPGFLVPVSIAVIGFVAWLIRLESKVNSTEKSVLKLEMSVGDTWESLEGHRTNNDVHFNQRLATEVERRQGDRFTRLEGDLKEIKDIVKGLAAK